MDGQIVVTAVARFNESEVYWEVELDDDDDDVGVGGVSERLDDLSFKIRLRVTVAGARLKGSELCWKVDDDDDVDTGGIFAAVVVDRFMGLDWYGEAVAE